MKSHPFAKMCLRTQAFDDVDGDTTQDVVLFLGAHVNIKNLKNKKNKRNKKREKGGLCDNGRILLLVLVLFFLFFLNTLRSRPF
jgi:hypothetical protein